jgi:AcrR family transcriptional regulator
MPNKKKALTTTSRLKKVSGGGEENILSEFSRKKREQILQAAMDTFLELGYGGASMNLVAERAGVIKQTIYSHFQDKESLFICVISSLTVDHVQHIFTKTAVESQSPEQILRTLAQTLASRQFDPRFTKLLRITIGESGRFPKIAQLYIRATVKPGSELLIQYLKNHPDIHLPDPEAFARVYTGAIINHCIQQHILHGKTLFPFELSRVVDELIRIFKMCSQSDGADKIASKT